MTNFPENVQKTPAIHGHRGCRGLLPENSLPAFRKALELGVDALELDVVVSRDKQVVVSHEPYLSHVICSGPEGEDISPADEASYNLYQLDYATIRRCDCGSRQLPFFPGQQAMPVFKPLLSEVIEQAETFCRINKRKPVLYNIETKSTAAGDGIFHPEPEEFTHLLLEVLSRHDVTTRSILQSFDVRTLQVAHKLQAKLQLALLVENNLSLKQNLNLLGFIPHIYSPDYALVTPELLKQAKKLHMQVIPWTVNAPYMMEQLFSLGVDGLITDYPDIAISIKNNL